MTNYTQMLKRLRFDSQQPAFFINVPSGLEHLPDTPYSEAVRHQNLEQVLLFVHDRSELDALLPGILSLTDSKSVLWVAYPKLSGSIRSDLTRDVVWKEVERMGRRPVGQSPLNDTWSAMWLKYPELVKSQRAEYQEVDTINRIISLPDDLHDALLSHNLLHVFEKMTFSLRREQVEAVLGAKKPETRVARIAKCVKAMQFRAAAAS
jgi:hypothetical protein